jgi:hypothetical protein
MSYGAPSMINRQSINFGPDETSPDQPKMPSWKDYGPPGKRYSDEVETDELGSLAVNFSINNSIAGQGARDEDSDRSSKNFSKKLASIMVPENGVPLDDFESDVTSPKSAPIVDSAMQTPLKGSFGTNGETKKARPSSVAFAADVIKKAQPNSAGSTGDEIKKARPNSVAFASAPMKKARPSSAVMAGDETKKVRPSSAMFAGDETKKARPTSVAFASAVMKKARPSSAVFAGDETKKARPNSAAFAGDETKKARPNSAAFAGQGAPVGTKKARPVSVAWDMSSGMQSRRGSTVGDGRRRSSVITNVVIPSHLLTHVETNWQQDKVISRRSGAYTREDKRKSFNIQALAQSQQEEITNIINATTHAPRQLSESMVALSQADPFAAARNRKSVIRNNRKSLAAVNEGEMGGIYNDDDEDDEEEEEQEADDNEKQEGLTPWGRSSTFNAREGGTSPGGPLDPSEFMWNGGDGAGTGMDTATTTGAASAEPRRRSLWRGSMSIDPNAPYNGERRGTIFQRAGSVFQDTMQQVRKKVRRSSLWDVYEHAKKRQVELRRKRWVQLVFEYTFYVILVALLYFLIIGVPLWKGTYWELYLAFKYKLNAEGTWTVVIAVAVAYSYSPLFVLFEPDPPMPEQPHDPNKTPNVADTALMIPCYKAANLIGATLEAACKVFPPQNIFVVANGNSPTPLDDTEEICRPYGVNHIWSPVGSKIVAQFVGCYAAKSFKNVLLIDDDCALPPNFPIVSDRLKGKVMCLGYTIKSVGPESSKGTLCQQAQDLEYKISGIQRALAGKIGSATFPHGAISLWDREFLIKTFNKHPGFSVSEDWFFGHVARQLGCRTQMATSVFIETETPPAVFFHSGGARGGFGEMTVFKQRFLRWNFFFVNGMYYNLHYILFSWELGWWELGTKLFVFQEIYETLLYLATPIVVPVSLIVRPQFFFELMALTFFLYMGNAVIFNELHLRRKHEKVPQKCVWFYYMPYKLVLTFVNVASCYWAIYKYATYFANRHPKIIEDEKAVNVVLQLEEEEFEDDEVVLPVGGRRMSVTAVGSQVDVPGGAPGGRRMTITAMGQRFSDPDIITEDESEELIKRSMEPSRRASISIVKTGEAPAPFEASRPTITVDGRRVSVGGASIIDDTPDSGSRSRRLSDAYVSKEFSVTSEPSDATDAAPHKVSVESSSSSGSSNNTLVKARRRMSLARASTTLFSQSVLEDLRGEASDEEAGGEEQQKAPLPASDIESRRRSKRKSQLMMYRQSYHGPTVTETEFSSPHDNRASEVPVVDDLLLNRINAIEAALKNRGIGAVDFAVHDDQVASSAALAEEDEDDEFERESSSTSIVDEKKHLDAKSMV